MTVERDSRATEDRVGRVAVGIANILLSGMLVYAVIRFQRSVATVYGDRFSYVPIAMVAIAGWRAVVGVLVLFGRRRGI